LLLCLLRLLLSSLCRISVIGVIVVSHRVQGENAICKVLLTTFEFKIN
jgi:hypothetical protein